jgi:tetratricopeptide (TPR) repeat protein
MEVTIDQALQKGIEAHKTGQVQEADRLYTAILQAQPKHPDANHNMGVLAVGVGKVEQALPFFKTALEANPVTAQFWLSYIDALIKLERLADAKAVLDQARSKNAKGDGFDKLEQLLKEAVQEPLEASKIATEVPAPQPNILDSLKLDQAIKFAKKKAKEGDPEKAKRIYQDILTKFPKNKRASDGLKGLADKSVGKSSKVQDPSQDQFQPLINLYSQGQLQKALAQVEVLLQKFPNSVTLYNIQGAALNGLGQLDAAIGSYNKALSINPDNCDASYNMGNALQDQGKLEEAIEAYIKALAIKPDYAEAYLNLGNALKDQGKLEEGVEAYNKALAIKPDYAEAYNNMGNALKKQGKLDEAVEAYNKALTIKPDYVEAYNNMGLILQEQGKLDEAVEAYNKALTIKPDYVEAYYNMGNALQDQSKLEETIEAYNNALALKPDYADVFFNLSGTATNISAAKNWIEQCLKADPDHSKAKLTLSALQFYEGDESEFNALMQSSSKDHPYMRSFAWAFGLPELPELFFHRWALFDRIVKLSKKARPFYEYGVWRGEAFQYLIKTFKKGYGFDTFEGIPEDWHDKKAGTYSSEGNIPQIEGGEFIVGKFEDTLPGFFSEPRPMASIINFDADLYSSTICALNFSKPVIDKHTILIFDEFIINGNWEQDEYKALNEFCLNNNFTYEVLAISFFTQQAAVRLIGI